MTEQRRDDGKEPRVVTADEQAELEQAKRRIPGKWKRMDDLIADSRKADRLLFRSRS